MVKLDHDHHGKHTLPTIYRERTNKRVEELGLRLLVELIVQVCYMFLSLDWMFPQIFYPNIMNLMIVDRIKLLPLLFLELFGSDLSPTLTG